MKKNNWQKRINIKNLLGEKEGFSLDQDISVEKEIIRDNRIKLLKPILGKLVLVKTKDGILVEYNLKIYAEFTCDRCLNNFKKELDINFSQKYSFKKEKGKEEILPISLDQTIEIGEPIRQEILSSIPYKILCKEGCKGLCDKCGKNLNKGGCNCK